MLPKTYLENVQTDEGTEFVDIVVVGSEVRPYQSAMLALFTLITIARFLLRLCLCNTTVPSSKLC